MRYSILLRQESLTKKAYEYLLLMKKNTESLGSIFDPQPSDLKGNIQCISNPDEGVIGYVTASSLSEKRIFITSSDANWKFNLNCPEVLYIPNRADSIRLLMPSTPPIDLIVKDFQQYYTASVPACVDCVSRGGDLAMPSYW